MTPAGGEWAADVAVVGGCGRAGLPFGIALASRGLTVLLYDTDAAAVREVDAGRMPFREEAAEAVLPGLRAAGRLVATTDRRRLADAEHVVLVVPTPLDEHLDPKPEILLRVLDECAGQLRSGQLLLLRSTVGLGVTALVERAVEHLGVAVAYCPERTAEGAVLRELFELPQIVGARNREAAVAAEKLFHRVGSQVVPLEPEEAELAKLYANAWRYLTFAVANQFWMTANDSGLDFGRIRDAVQRDYPRAAGLPAAGFAAGPCLLKDTMQLAAASRDGFPLAHAAMRVNEGLPRYLVDRLESRHDLAQLTVGVLGMAFKGGSDDPRESLAYKLRKLLLLRARAVLCSDPYVEDDRLLPLEEVLARADLLVIGAPHEEYRRVPAAVPVVDVWGLRGEGVRV